MIDELNEAISYADRYLKHIFYKLGFIGVLTIS